MSSCEFTQRSLEQIQFGMRFLYLWVPVIGQLHWNDNAVGTTEVK